MTCFLILKSLIIFSIIGNKGLTNGIIIMRPVKTKRLADINGPAYAEELADVEEPTDIKKATDIKKLLVICYKH